MYSTFAALILLAGVATIEGCKPANVATCTKAPSSNSPDAICKAAKEMVACFETALAGCAPEITEQFEDMLKQNKDMAVCDEDSSCSMTKMQKCMEGMPQDMSSGNVTPDVMCPKMATLKTCLNNLLPNCKHEQTKTQIETQLKNFEPMSKMCPKTEGQGEGYETDTKANTGTGEKKEGGEKVDDGEKDGATGLQVALSLLALSMFVQIFARM